MSSLKGGKQDRISEFMFGTRHTKQENKTQDHGKIADLISTIDLNQLMNQVDSIMTVYDQVKPAIKQLSPIMDIFLKRKK
ncbi:hypothetical protein [Peribacillus deserti]|uniref:Uncharacterized protein n=1 Tax=Peribacillus deserti TaxID=673318 RepID=A0A2N5M7R3_9BACI|nr:hypothetical protein [Peribacillus deserti]PLT30387.1 hypothetical protein CUU66_07910 [Peribacillus deserti]